MSEMMDLMRDSEQYTQAMDNLIAGTHSNQLTQILFSHMTTLSNVDIEFDPPVIDTIIKIKNELWHLHGNKIKKSNRWITPDYKLLTQEHQRLLTKAQTDLIIFTKTPARPISRLISARDRLWSVVEDRIMIDVLYTMLLNKDKDHENRNRFGY